MNIGLDTLAAIFRDIDLSLILVHDNINNLRSLMPLVARILDPISARKWYYAIVRTLCCHHPMMMNSTIPSWHPSAIGYNRLRAIRYDSDYLVVRLNHDNYDSLCRHYQHHSLGTMCNLYIICIPYAKRMELPVNMIGCFREYISIREIVEYYRGANYPMIAPKIAPLGRFAKNFIGLDEFRALISPFQLSACHIYLDNGVNSRDVASRLVRELNQRVFQWLQIYGQYWNMNSMYLVVANNGRELGHLRVSRAIIYRKRAMYITPKKHRYLLPIIGSPIFALDCETYADELESYFRA